LIAGLLIAETEYHGEVEGITAPFKGLALGVFLITVGMGIDLAKLAADPLTLLAATAGVILVKALVTGVLLRLMGARAGTATEAGILLSSPSETTLIVLSSATAAGLVAGQTAQFWQSVTALGLTVTPILGWLGRRLARRVDANAPAPAAQVEDGPRAVIIGFGRVGRMVADLLRAHDKPFVGVDSDPDLVREANAAGYPAVFGDAMGSRSLERFGIEHANAVILTMDEPVAAARLVRRLREEHPDLPIIARARDAGHAGQLYRAGASHAVPETLEASLQLAEAVLVDLAVPMGFVIASIHEKRDELRQQIMDEGQLDAKPVLKSGSLRERAGS
jgi:CPA2 family monovalent cation:H+ antiporter-2